MAKPDEARLKLYDTVRAELSAAREKSFEQFDSAILTLASGGLGVSFAFVTDVVPIGKARVMWILVASWILFSLAIVSTLCSFLMSQAAIDTALRDAADYYLGGDENAATRTNRWGRLTRYLNRGSAGFFMAAVGATVLFVALNLGIAREHDREKEAGEAAGERAVQGGVRPPAAAAAGEAAPRREPGVRAGEPPQAPR